MDRFFSMDSRIRRFYDACVTVACEKTTLVLSGRKQKSLFGEALQPFSVGKPRRIWAYVTAGIEFGTHARERGKGSWKIFVVHTTIINVERNLES